LIGRDADLAGVSQLVLEGDGRLVTLTGAGGCGKTSLVLEGDCRLVTLTGAGGCGKTSLALHVARGLADQFSDRVWWIELAPLTEAGLIPQVVASVFGVRRVGCRPASSQFEVALARPPAASRCTSGVNGRGECRRWSSPIRAASLDPPTS
jgi:predicted ATPase